MGYTIIPESCQLSAISSQQRLHPTPTSLGFLLRSIVVLGLLSISAAPASVQPGIEVLAGRNFDILQGKRVGLITNPTGVDSRLNSTVDILFKAPGVQLKVLFGPEHGVRGDFAGGESVDSSTDAATGLPVFSLYGRMRKPSTEMLRNLDVLVYDIQDIGCRSYTYVSTMGLAMEAAAAANIEFVVLDRPNPLGGLKVEGGLVEPGFISFVSQFPIPYVYGLTCGELAKVLNEEGLLAGAVKCRLTVVPMTGWTREMQFEETGLPWVPTSPHIPEASSPEYYVSTGVLGELGIICEGVGYTIPFHTFAAEWIDGNQLATRMNALGLEGVIFRPITFKPFYGRLTGKELHGVQLHFTDYAKVNLLSLQFLFLQVHNEMYPDKNPFQLAERGRLHMFDMVAGSDQVRLTFAERMKYEDIRERLEKPALEFSQRAMPYRLYP
jgi:uncharacterized protein YbbC (DUF1343 family)